MAIDKNCLLCSNGCYLYLHTIIVEINSVHTRIAKILEFRKLFGTFIAHFPFKNFIFLKRFWKSKKCHLYLINNSLAKFHDFRICRNKKAAIRNVCYFCNQQVVVTPTSTDRYVRTRSITIKF